MVCLAVHDNSRPCRKQQIAAAEGISADYVEQLLMKLKTAGLVVSQRGARGGFLVARAPRTITVAEVLEATEGPFRLAPCDTQSCDRLSVCVTSPLWDRAADSLKKLFDGVTIADLAAEAKSLRDSSALTFEI
jgi:Rrf2 family protein